MTDKALERYELLMECKQWENKKGEAIDLEEIDDKQELKQWRKSLDGSC